MRINQEVLAKNLNVSIATVSRSLQNHPDISPETRDRVWEEAERLGYRRGAKRRESATFGVLISCTDPVIPGSPLDGMYLLGMSAAAQSHDATLLMHHFQGEGDERLLDPAHQPTVLRPGKVSGLVLVHSFAAETATRLAAAMPCVTLAHHVPAALADHVDSDHQTAMSELVGHLTGHGHRRIGYVMRRSSAIPVTRFASFVRAVMLAGLEWDPALLEDLPLETAVAENRRTPTAQVLADQTATIDCMVAAIRAGTTAWCCDSDATAYWVYRLLRDRGIRVPDDVSITGYDGFDPYPECPQITTVQVPFQELGRLAIARLLERIADPASAHRQTLVRSPLKSGLTTGPAPRR